ncbi:MAG: aldehyde ferredoxin oxidoreductase family protein [Promethearchaeota archaeon]
MKSWPLKSIIIDLTSRKIKIRETHENFARLYLGERGFNSRKLWDLVNSETDALNPNNPLLIGIGPLCGTLAPCSSRFTISAKSPLTDILGSSNCGGHFGPELRYAGYNQLIILGKSKYPVYLWIDDENIEIRDARNIWGQDTWKTQEIIMEDLGDATVKSICIGLAGENLVRYACIISGLSSAAGRTGMGAVMGSKNLKAVSIRGTKDIEISEPDKFIVKCKEVFNNIKKARNPKWTSLYLMELNANMLGGSWTGKCELDREIWGPGSSAVKSVGGTRFMEDFMRNMRACFNCPIHCKPFYEVKEGKYSGLIGEGPDYGLTLIAPYCDIREMEPILYMNNLINQYGIDSLSLLHNIAWLMNCYEKKIITTEEVNGLNLIWGNSDAVIELIHLIVKKQGIGKILAEGEKRASKLLGRGSEKFIFPIKGMSETSFPRITGSHAPGYITSTRGGDHLRALFIPATTPKNLLKKYFPELRGGFTLNSKENNVQGYGKVLKWFEDFSAVVNSVGLCIFSCSVAISPRKFEELPEVIADLITTSTGIKFNAKELILAGERIINVEKAFNSREGLTIKDDDYYGAKKIINHSGINQYYKDREIMLNEYYSSRGWDIKTGFQKKSQLERLDLKDIANELEKNKAIVKVI